MQRISLNGEWRMTGGGFDVTGNIPGSVYSFLLDKQLIPDPWYRENATELLPLMEHDYTFSRTFTYTNRGVRVLLHCDGLDTVCDVLLNGVSVGHTQNMHRTYEWDVTDLLKEGENEIAVAITSPVNEFLRRDAQNPQRFGIDIVRGFQHLRKAWCMSGWDWGPMLPDAGIWRDIYLLEADSPRITAMRLLQRHENGRVWLTTLVETDEPCAITLTLEAPNGQTTALQANVENEIDNPQLWWPNGAGDQPLYTVTATVDGDVMQKRIGLRTMKLIRKPDRWGASFYHEVNGEPIFAMGADYIPEDNIFSRITPERTRRLLQQAHDCHFNAIRVWGGGYYPDDWFYDACDEFGLMVFQDMMVACYMPPDQADFAEEFEAEVRENLGRIRHHASLALISGNNENEMSNQWHYEHGELSDGLREQYYYVFEERLPQIVAEVCPEFVYVSSSPTTRGHFIDPNNENYGDGHFWASVDDPYKTLRNHYFRYVSEFGCLSLPSYKTICDFTEPEDRNLSSHVMDFHIRCQLGHGHTLNAISKLLPYATSLEMLVFSSQYLQALRLKTTVEHLRRNRGRCMGALYWQFNDIWPCATWASIDAYGRYKQLQYAAKRFYAPVLLSCEEVGERDSRLAVYQQDKHFDYRTAARLCVTNDTRKTVNGTVRWSLRREGSTVIQSGEEAVSVAPLSVYSLTELDFHKTDFYHNHLWYELEVDGVIVSAGSVLFTVPKYYHFADPNLTVVRNGDIIVVHADNYAHTVWIDSPDTELILSDNGFDMEAGDRIVKIVSGDPQTLTVRSVYDVR